ncbi:MULTISPECIES: hypothetical protein [Planktothricoides]|uniref:Uncharacterized protein n=2 Tax=Planktothricoides raciborskii TaxID=132608 RepID=A0AAU8JHF5_9CYAN|nr:MULTISPECIES: hypothetical protein [Planktothricoides]MBD2546483.1 hypothetical protein [Planktothricoides raciborskii FACHB-1370]MBD2582270.1 hypothetical protein [Planktothricoides raciborskii FACHB-1261]
MAIAIVDYAHGTRETQFPGMTTNGQSILWVRDASTNHRVDVHVEVPISR